MPKEEIFIGEFIHICSCMTTGETDFFFFLIGKRKRIYFSKGKTAPPDLQLKVLICFYSS